MELILFLLFIISIPLTIYMFYETYIKYGEMMYAKGRLAGFKVSRKIYRELVIRLKERLKKLEIFFLKNK